MKKKFLEKVKDLKNEIEDFKIIESSKGLTKKERKYILDKQFLIKEGKELVISGGGKLCFIL